MRLAASEMPPLSAPTFDGRVHSVFRRVVNLRLGGGELLTLYAADDASGPPGAITFAAPANLDFSDHVEHQSKVSCRAGILRIEGSDVSIDLRRARQRDPETIGLCRDGADTGFSASWHTAWQTLLADDGDGLVAALHGRRAAGALDTALAGRARQTVPQLLAAVRAKDIVTAMSAAAGLVGAGPGLTPSGDDYLAGFLVGARHTAQNKAEIAFLDALGRQLSTQHGNSGDIACLYLAHAAAGRAARPLVNLARLITNSATAPDTKAATVAAMRMGHSSGSDATFGLLCGLTAWRRKPGAPVTAISAGDVQ
jgi:hypothetical protein